ncbi:filamentous hemagglutinin N-terminal domain-containing protein [Leptothoe sp. LEGE 181152]|nr:filamentous hemagglutinin N-terminal domain-containing protein [Leptothoe sp. LEGE 181152]
MSLNRGKLWLLLVITSFLLPSRTQAQIVPDTTLGTESSSLIPEQLMEGELADLIDGGALRGSNLFHSFGEFNVADGQRVYFVNPADVESILSRVTGENPSEIFGTLGVDGPASLFLINPNGLVFGENAQLDIEGSFYGTTADGVDVGGEVFSAVAPDQRGLLSVNPSVAFWNYLTAGDIVNRGALATGGDLVLVGKSLDLQNQVTALGDVSLLATDGIRIRDTAEVPFIALAGDELLVQGNQQVDIVALSHPDSGLFSYGDMVLRSAERVSGDAHYLSGGDFRVERLDGSDGKLYSPIDPIVRTLGDVRIGTYRGSSLHILAGGSVTIGTAEITATEGTNLDVDFLRETIMLSDGTVVEVDGSAQPTLDVRAGVRPEAIGTPPLTLLTGFNGNTDSFSDDSVADQTPMNANISLGDVALESANGLVLLTNQYEPNENLSDGNILITGEGERGFGINAQNFSGVGGAVYLDARNNIDVLNSAISITSTADVQDIVLIADGIVTFDGLDGTRATAAAANLIPGETGNSGNVEITANSLNVLNGAQLNSVVFGNGQGGDIILNIQETARFSGSNPRNGRGSGASSIIGPDGQGIGGNVHIEARNLEVLDGAQLRVGTVGIGNAGSVVLLIDETARFEGSMSGVFNSIQADGAGSSGDVHIHARNLDVLEGAQIISSVFGIGSAGNVLLVIEETVRFKGVAPGNGSASGSFSSIAPNGQGVGGDVRIHARNLEVLNGAQLNSNTSGIGNAGSVILVIEETARFESINPNNGFPSEVSSAVRRDGQGSSGDVYIRARNLQVVGGAQLGSGSFGIGDAGSVILVIEEIARFEGINPTNGSSGGAFSSIQPNAEGTGGDIHIRTGNLEVLEGAVLSASSFGMGDAGNIILTIEETAQFEGSNVIDGAAGGAFSSISPNGEGAGGDVRIHARNLEVLEGAQLSASTIGGIGDSGSVILVIEETARFEGGDPRDGSPSGAFSGIEPNSKGTGGDVRIRARNLEVLEGAQLSASTSGIGNAGGLILVIEETAQFEGTDPRNNGPSGVFTSIAPSGEGIGGNIRLVAKKVEVNDGAALFSGSLGQGIAGNILLTIHDSLIASSGTIATNAEQDAGGQIQIDAGSIFLFGDSDIQTFVNSGENNGGNITIRANALVGLDDSDILAFAADGRGGDVDLSETAFFGQNFQFSPPGTDPRTLDNNDRVDINATGGIASGTISLADVSFIEDSLSELPDNLVNPETLVANSCVVRTNDTDSSFTITGSDSLREQPGNSSSSYSLETVQSIPAATETAVAEPQGTYRLADGRLVLGRACHTDR